MKCSYKMSTHVQKINKFTNLILLINRLSTRITVDKYFQVQLFQKQGKIYT